MPEPIQTSLLINWVSALFGLTLVSTVFFALGQFVSMLRTDMKSAVMALVVIASFVGLFLISYTMGDGTPLPGLNLDSQKYNTEGWLKLTDMWIYTTFGLIILILGAVLLGTVKRVLNK